MCIDAFSPEYNSSPKATAPLLGVMGKNHPRTGCRHSAETRDKMRKSARRGADNLMYGKTGENHPKFGIKYKNPKQSGLLNPMYQRGHIVSGENNGRCKLNDNQVVEILLSSNSYSCLARKYNISKSQIAKIKQGKSRKTAPERVA